MVRTEKGCDEKFPFLTKSFGHQKITKSHEMVGKEKEPIKKKYHVCTFLTKSVNQKKWYGENSNPFFSFLTKSFQRVCK